MHEIALDTTSGLIEISWAPEYARIAREMLPVDPLEVQIGVA
jgi:hypothetical protein